MLKRILVLYIMAASLISGHAHAAEQHKYRQLSYAGQDTAPVSVYVFSSLSCIFCKEFNFKVAGELRKNYINTGKVKYVFVNTVNVQDIATFNAHAAAYTAQNSAEFFKLVSWFYENSDSWVGGNQQNVVSVASLAGKTPAQINAVLNDPVFVDMISSDLMSAIQNKVAGTPTTFVIKTGDVVVDSSGAVDLSKSVAVLKGSTNYTAVEQAIEKALK